MKKLKTLISVVLSAMLVLSLVVPSMASDFKITVNGKAGETYTAYKIFNVSYTGTGTNARGVYTATTAMKTLIGTNVTGVTISNDTDASGNYYVTVADADAAADLAVFLNNNVASLTKKVDGTIAVGDTSVVLDVGEAGYYFVNTTSGSLCILNSATPTIEVTDKNNDVTVEKKIVEGGVEKDANSVEIGDTVNFKTEVVIPANSKNVVLHDKMETGFTLGATITVKVGGQNLAAANYTITKTGLKDDCDFEIAFAQSYLDGLTAANTTVVVEYSAILNENAEIKTSAVDAKNTNETWATYGAGQKTEVDFTDTTTLDFDLFKYASGAETVALNGAQFTLHIDSSDNAAINLVKVGDNYRVAKDGEQGTTIIDAGAVNISGLDADVTYVLLETKAPEGYNREQDDIPVTLNGTVEVENNQGALLPTTGGMGTKVLFTVGGIMMVVAFVLFTSKRRMAAED